MSRKRILIVDDEPSITRLLKLNPEQTGSYEVRVENLGTKAYEAAQEFLPDLVLLDVMMPDMDRSDVAASLKEDPDLRKIPVVFLTAQAHGNKFPTAKPSRVSCWVGQFRVEPKELDNLFPMSFGRALLILLPFLDRCV